MVEGNRDLPDCIFKALFRDAIQLCKQLYAQPRGLDSIAVPEVANKDG